MYNNINLSICVPAFNEEKNLKESVEDLISTLSPLICNLEIIIVNDGSFDSTYNVAENLAKQYSQIKVIHHKKNLGIGVCYRDALRKASGEYFTWFPSDHENYASEFIQCLPYLTGGDIVTCHHRGLDPRPALRRCISFGYAWVLNVVFSLNLKFYNGLTIFPIATIRSFCLVSNGFALFAESMIRTAKSGYQVVELSSPMRRRKQGKAKSLSFRSFLCIVKDLLRFVIIYKCNIKPNR